MQIRGQVEWLGILISLYVLKSHFRYSGAEWTRRLDWVTIDHSLRAAGAAVFFIAIYKGAIRGIKLAPNLDGSAKLLAQKLTLAVVLGIGVVTVLTQFQIDVAPILASLGVAGLAVALALQDTLGNYFAGITMSIDRPLRPGDYVKMENGVEGFVESIGWRTTRIKPFSESVVVVPNSVLANSILTNNYYPDTATRVYVACGVSYESNLEHVEAVCVEVAERVGSAVRGYDTDFTPIVRFSEFADSNVNFTVILRALNFDDTFLIKHEFMKALHARFKAEGITINYPVRQVRMAQLPAESEADFLPKPRATDRLDGTRTSETL
jgi:small-conductance mechanosensitive channel